VQWNKKTEGIYLLCCRCLYSYIASDIYRNGIFECPDCKSHNLVTFPLSYDKFERLNGGKE